MDVKFAMSIMLMITHLQYRLEFKIHLSIVFVITRPQFQFRFESHFVNYIYNYSFMIFDFGLKITLSLTFMTTNNYT